MTQKSLDISWDKEIIELLNSLSVNTPTRSYIICSSLCNIIILKHHKVKINLNIESLYVILENLIKKSNTNMINIINSIKEDDIPIEMDSDIAIINQQRWDYFQRICELVYA